MYYLFEDGKFRGSSDKPISQSNCETIQAEFTHEEFEQLQHGYLYIDGEIVTSEEVVAFEILKIKEDFDKQISEYLNKYTQREQDTFTKKEMVALRVLGGGSSIYITGKAKFLSEVTNTNITPKMFAQSILQKSEVWEQKYLDLENERDLSIINLQK